MQKICILIITLIFSEAAVSQKKPNPTIGKKEVEISLFYFGETPGNSYIGFGRHLAGAQIVRRWAWKKNTKLGVGGLMGVIDSDPIYESDLVAYGALFADITHFIGKRQKWVFSGQIGHGIFKREEKFDEPTFKGVVKHTAGMYYSFSYGYRAIISKRSLLVISFDYSIKNFREKGTVERYSPPSVEDYTSGDNFRGPGIRLGIVF